MRCRRSHRLLCVSYGGLSFLPHRGHGRTSAGFSADILIPLRLLSKTVQNQALRPLSIQTVWSYAMLLDNGNYLI